MNCLVTGGAGFIGSHLVEALVRDGHQVTVVDNLSTGKRENLSRVMKNIKFVEADINDESVLNRVFPKTAYLFHYAALASVSESFQNPRLNFQTNIAGTAAVLQAAIEHKIKKIIFCSSAALYNSKSEGIKKEIDSLSPASPYAYSKLIGEQLCQMCHNVYGIDVIIYRFFNVYGSRQSATSQYAGVISCFIDRILQNQSLFIYGDGHQTRDFIHVHDIVSASLLALKTDASGTYNLGFGKCHNILAIAKTLQSFVDRDIKMEFKEERRGMPVFHCRIYQKPKKSWDLLLP